MAEAPQNALFIQARRLVEAGAGYVGLAWGNWDDHGAAFPRLRRQLPKLDIGLSNLIDELAVCGRLEHTLIIVASEFGRTPYINYCGGRDHWSRSASWLVAGGTLHHGQIVGATDSYGGEPLDASPTLDELLATLYMGLGIDARQLRLFDNSGREQRLLPATTSLIAPLVGSTGRVAVPSHPSVL